MIRARRAVALVVAAALATGGCTTGNSSTTHDAPSPEASSSETSGDGPYQPTDADRREIRELLEARAAAVGDGDEDAFMATVDDADGDLVERQRALFSNLTRLPVASIAYAVDDAAGLPPADVKGDDPTFRPSIVENVRLAGIDMAPVGNVLEDTFVKRDGAWLLGAETPSGDYPEGQEPQSRPWGGGVELAVARRGGLVVVADHDQRSVLPQVVDAVARGIVADARELGTQPRYDLLVDASTTGSATMMNTLDDAQAAAVTFSVHTLDESERRGPVAGMRVKINPDLVETLSTDDYVLRHELVHFLTSDRLGAWPSWLAEGLADYVANQPRPFDQSYFAPEAAALDGVPEALPTTAKWGLARTDYLIAQAAVTYLVDTYGMTKVLELAKAYEDRTSGDDPDQVTRRLLPRTLALTEGELVHHTWDLLDSLG